MLSTEMDLAKTLCKTENSSISSHQYNNVEKGVQTWNSFLQAMVDPFFQPSLLLPPRMHFLKGSICSIITTSERHW